MSLEREVWIALLEVEQRPGAGLLLDRNKVFVNVLALASNEREFRNGMAQTCEKLGFDMRMIEDPEPLRQRTQHYEVDQGILDLARQVEESGSPRFGEFYTWRSED
jgi:hypothetical protein